MTTRNARLFSVDPSEFFGREAANVYGVDVREDADHLYVEAELPGFKKDEVEIVLDKSVLTISATHAAVTAPATTGEAQGETPEAKPTQWLLRERTVRDYRRAFRLPPTADGAAVSATLEDGVLRLTLTKREETKPRKITVS